MNLEGIYPISSGEIHVIPGAYSWRPSVTPLTLTWARSNVLNSAEESPSLGDSRIARDFFFFMNQKLCVFEPLDFGVDDGDDG